jgi:hypothetical protein
LKKVGRSLPLWRMLVMFSAKVLNCSLGVRRAIRRSAVIISRPKRSISRTAMFISLAVSP